MRTPSFSSPRRRQEPAQDDGLEAVPASLSECLLLQLSQGPHFNALTTGLVRDGLELMAGKQYAELAKCYHTDKKSILAAVAVISQLNPIPSQGFGSHDYDAFVIPDAFIT